MGYHSDQQPSHQKFFEIDTTGMPMLSRAGAVSAGASAHVGSPEICSGEVFGTPEARTFVEQTDDPK